MGLTVASSDDLTPRPSRGGEVWPRVIGTIVCVTVGSAFVSPRTIPYTTPVLAVATIAALWIQGRADALKPRLEAAEWAILALLAYAVVSMTWSSQPSAALVPIVTGFGYFCGYVLIASALRNGEPDLARRIAEGLCIGLVFGLLYLGFEIFTNQNGKLILLRELHVPRSWLRPYRDYKWSDGVLISIEPGDLTRNIAPVTLVLWAALLALQKLFRPEILWRVLGGLLFALAAMVIVKSEHETSKAALLFGSIVFVVAHLSIKWSDRLLKLAWCLACLAVVPSVLGLYRLGIENAPWVQPSLRARIEIWNSTAEQSFKAPILGVGAGMMYRIAQKGAEQGAEKGEYSLLAPHAHNVFLQTWFELGAVGAVILTLIGLAIIERMRALADHLVPYAHATFTSAAAMAAASYGMWQPWFIAMFMLCTVMFIAVMYLDAASDTESAATASE